MKQFTIFGAGLLFSFGLILSGMINPAKVLGFLDLAGAWDPSLGFVMAGAVLVTLLGFKTVLRRPTPFYESHYSLPTRVDIDRNLLLGAALFGVGWGLVGLCPGPALAAFAVLPLKTGLFVFSMLIGMYLPRFLPAGAVRA
jgi:uncharacterized membrane protein YedE/YeeE